jgi:hypothetical protein
METHNLAMSLDLPKQAIALVLAGGRGSRLITSEASFESLILPCRIV